MELRLFRERIQEPEVVIVTKAERLDYPPFFCCAACGYHIYLLIARS